MTQIRALYFEQTIVATAVHLYLRCHTIGLGNGTNRLYGAASTAWSQLLKIGSVCKESQQSLSNAKVIAL